MTATSDDGPKVVDVSSDIDDIPDLEEVSPTKDAGSSNQEPGEEGHERPEKINRAEKKNRRAIQKLGANGLKPYPGVEKVTIRKNKSIFFVINKPEVYKYPASGTTPDTYIVFGAAKIEDLSAKAQSDAAAQLAKMVPEVIPSKPNVTADEPADDDEGDDGEIPEADIKLLMGQVPNTSRAQAVRALKKKQGDVVEAILELCDGGR
eukprot:Selendium_serpulae@DN2971_c0_g1_i1.p3